MAPNSVSDIILTLDTFQDNLKIHIIYLLKTILITKLFFLIENKKIVYKNTYEHKLIIKKKVYFTNCQHFIPFN